MADRVAQLSGEGRRKRKAGSPVVGSGPAQDKQVSDAGFALTTAAIVAVLRAGPSSYLPIGPRKLL